MMAALPLIEWSEEEYLEFEEESLTKHEFYYGNISAMAGATETHISIVSNLMWCLGAQIQERPCKMYASEMRVRISADVYVYPDAVVVCGEGKFVHGKTANLLNPTLIIEVLSPSTEKHDRTSKFQNYQLLESLQEYLLISQDKAQIERYLRQENGDWALTEAIGLEAVLELPSIGCKLELAEVYRKVTFETE